MAISTKLHINTKRTEERTMEGMEMEGLGGGRESTSLFCICFFPKIRVKCLLSLEEPEGEKHPCFYCSGYCGRCLVRKAG